jgi:hypothetical protein
VASLRQLGRARREAFLVFDAGRLSRGRACRGRVISTTPEMTLRYAALADDTGSDLRRPGGSMVAVAMSLWRRVICHDLAVVSVVSCALIMDVAAGRAYHPALRMIASVRCRDLGQMYQDPSCSDPYRRPPEQDRDSTRVEVTCGGAGSPS